MTKIKTLDPSRSETGQKTEEQKRAKIYKMVQFTIILLNRQAEDSVVQPLSLQVDLGSQTTGFALVRKTEDLEAEESVAMFISLIERSLRQGFQQRASYRRRRRSANLRYRKPCFNNRAKKEGWLAQSVQLVGDRQVRLMEKPRRLAPIGEIVREKSKLETQAMENPEIARVEYQRGTLAGYTARASALRNAVINGFIARPKRGN
ncbi:MAG: RRXRR domain-containing protein [Deltaproteobacteria bacterium]|nr:RRXRR domain-containing protein [Deltaproteobacteria bacterium]